MKRRAMWKIGLFLVLIAALIGAGYQSRELWRPWIGWEAESKAESKSVKAPDQHEEHDDDHDEEGPDSESVILTDQAIVNLGLQVVPVNLGNYWRTLTIPGQIVERPGHSDHRVTSPAEGVVSRIFVHPGDTIRPGDELFRIRLSSDSVHQAQADFYLKTQERIIAIQQRERLVAAGDAIPKERLIEVDNQLARLEASVSALKRELLWRGLTDAQIEEVAQGHFVSEIVVRAPEAWSKLPTKFHGSGTKTLAPSTDDHESVGEVQELSVELGERVQSGQSLCLLAHHHALAIEGRAFAEEAPFLQRVVQMSWPVTVDFLEPEAAGWSPKPETFVIRHIANTVDPVQRTLSFWISLENEVRRVDANGRSLMLWRFRPGQRVRIRIPVEKLESVHVLPTTAVVRDGLENYVFVQNVNRFIRYPVRVLAQDREQVALANDGTLLLGMYVVREGAGRLNRAIKSASGGAPPGYHVHADGSLHKNSDDDK